MSKGQTLIIYVTHETDFEVSRIFNLDMCIPFFSQVTEENGSERWSRLKCFDFDNYDQKKKEWVPGKN